MQGRVQLSSSPGRAEIDLTGQTEALLFQDFMSINNTVLKPASQEQRGEMSRAAL